jgi:hypothetical protein
VIMITVIIQFLSTLLNGIKRRLWIPAVFKLCGSTCKR